MPRLSDLLSEKLKKQLIADVKKNAPAKPRPAPAVEQPKKPFVPRQTIVVPDFVAIDVETTGLDFSSDKIIEIGAVKFVNGKPGAEFISFVNPGKPIPAAITELTTITEADVAPAPTFSEVAPRLLEFIGTLPICGHQIEFDLTFINKALDKAGYKDPIGKQSIDTALLSKILLQSGTRFSLKSVSDKLEVTLNNAHRAINDARASGEVAALLIPKIAALPLNVLQTFAAAAPGSFFKHLVFKSLGNAPASVKIRAITEVPFAPKLTLPETFIPIDTDEIKNIFSDQSSLKNSMPSFSPRKSQLAMALEVTGALNTQSFLVAEAGTGTGKSLGYLVPASLWAVKNKTRLIVASRTRNLQDQLISKELPLISTIIDLKYSVLKGRSNYICLNRFERLLRGDCGNMSVRERFAIMPLVPWVATTETGDIEEQNHFNPKWFQKIWAQISAESHGCAGRRCLFYKNCFLQQARQKALSSHIVVINHALFFSEMCSENSFLGAMGPIIFDEAHHLESSGHRHLRVELDTSHVNLFIEMVNNLVQMIGNINETSEIYKHGKEIKSHLKTIRKRSAAFLDSIGAMAKKKLGDTPGFAEFQVTVTPEDFSCNIEAPAFSNTLDTLKEMLYHLKQAVAADPAPERELELVKESVLSCQERTSQIAADLHYLVAAQTEEHAFWAEGNLQKGWSKLCGVPLDVASLLSKKWVDVKGSIIFTSATLSVARSTEYFTDSIGIKPFSERTAISVFPTPFEPHQAILGGVKNAPDPDSPEFPQYIANIISDIHTSLQKNILVLFTANTMLSAVYQLLRENRKIDRQFILAQGVSGGRHALLEQFKQNQRMILLGTDSFWEGIDVPGEACEVVIIPRLPFPIPTHPLTMAIGEKMKKIHGESFMSYAVPEAVIRFRQGCGRLIRTSSDRGALVVLDNRIINKGYGKQFTRSLFSDFKTFEDKKNMFSAITAFFNENPEDRPQSSIITYVPFDEV
jgi:ATP-dependent DNA helicase DinG